MSKKKRDPVMLDSANKLYVALISKALFAHRELKQTITYALQAQERMLERKKVQD